MNRRSKWLAVLGAPVFALSIAVAAEAGDISTPETCPIPLEASADAGDSLRALRPTLLKVADDYDKQAAEHQEQAERYRSWASAEDMFGGTTYGKRYAAIYFADEANELEKEAAENRALAAKYRQLANSKDATKGC
jgi:hypothetical protein